MGKNHHHPRHHHYDKLLSSMPKMVSATIFFKSEVYHNVDMSVENDLRDIEGLTTKIVDVLADNYKDKDPSRLAIYRYSKSKDLYVLMSTPTDFETLNRCLKVKHRFCFYVRELGRRSVAPASLMPSKRTPNLSKKADGAEFEANPESSASLSLCDPTIPAASPSSLVSPPPKPAQPTGASSSAPATEKLVADENGDCEVNLDDLIKMIVSHDLFKNAIADLFNIEKGANLLDVLQDKLNSALNAAINKLSPVATASSTTSAVSDNASDKDISQVLASSAATSTSSVKSEPIVSCSTRSIHHALCDGCDAKIVGRRYKCLKCADFDFCESCIERRQRIHPPHRFVCLHSDNDYLSAISGLHACDGTGCTTTITDARYRCNICYDFDLCGQCFNNPDMQHDPTHGFVKFSKNGVPIPIGQPFARNSNDTANSTIADGSSVGQPHVESTAQPDSQHDVCDTAAKQPLQPYVDPHPIKASVCFSIVRGQLVSDFENTGSTPWPVGTVLQVVDGVTTESRDVAILDTPLEPGQHISRLIKNEVVSCGTWRVKPADVSLAEIEVVGKLQDESAEYGEVLYVEMISHSVMTVAIRNRSNNIWRNCKLELDLNGFKLTADLRNSSYSDCLPGNVVALKWMGSELLRPITMSSESEILKSIETGSFTVGPRQYAINLSNLMPNDIHIYRCTSSCASRQEYVDVSITNCGNVSWPADTKLVFLDKLLAVAQNRKEFVSLNGSDISPGQTANYYIPRTVLQGLESGSFPYNMLLRVGAPPKLLYLRLDLPEEIEKKDTAEGVSSEDETRQVETETLLQPIEAGTEVKTTEVANVLEAFEAGDATQATDTERLPEQTEVEEMRESLVNSQEAASSDSSESCANKAMKDVDVESGSSLKGSDVVFPVLPTESEHSSPDVVHHVTSTTREWESTSNNSEDYWDSEAAGALSSHESEYELVDSASDVSDLDDYETLSSQ